MFLITELYIGNNSHHVLKMTGVEAKSGSKLEMVQKEVAMRYASFIVRLWGSDSDTTILHHTLRGGVEHVQSRTVVQVRCLEDLTAFFRMCLLDEPSGECGDRGPNRGTG